MKKVLSLIIVAAMMISLSGCATSPNAASTAAPAASDTQTAQAAASTTDGGNASGENVDVVKIGLLMPYTGASARSGELQGGGVELCAERINEMGGIKSLGGAKVEIIKADTQCKPEVGATEAERLITEEKVDALIGTYNSSVGSAVIPIAEKYQVPFMCANTSNVALLSEGYEYAFRANICDSDDSIYMIEFLKDLRDTYGTGPQTFGIVYENSDWGTGMAEELRKTIPEIYGGEIILEEPYDANAADLTPLITKIKDASPDIIIPMSYNNDAILITQGLAQYKVDTTVLACSGGYTASDFLDKVGDDANYILTLANWDANILAFKPQEATDLNNKFKEKYGVNMEECSANGYLAAACLIDGFERAGTTDKKVVRDTLEATDLGADSDVLLLHPFTGVDFADVRGMHHQNSHTQDVFLQVQNGEFKMVGPLVTVGDDNPIVWPVPKWEDR